MDLTSNTTSHLSFCPLRWGSHQWGYSSDDEGIDISSCAELSMFLLAQWLQDHNIDLCFAPVTDS